MAEGWPFWAATSDERIDLALDLAGVEEGTHLVDLGCGDGRVLLRAAVLRGARVTGVELDPALAETARSLLHDHEVEGTVLEEDFSRLPLADLAPDVVFAYLSPATLQRLKPALATQLRPGSRVVTTGYAVPGWLPSEAGGRCYLYRMPPADDPEPDRAPPGWDGGGVLVALSPGAPSLVAVKLRHAGGAVRLEAGGGVDVRAGADDAPPGTDVVVDLRFTPMAAGGVVDTTVTEASAGTFRVLAVADDGTPGVWGLPAEGCEAVAAALARGDAPSVLESARRAGS